MTTRTLTMTAAFVAALATPALAADVVLVPTSGGVGAEMPDIANRITAVIQKVAARHGLAAQLADASRADTLAVAGCTDDTDACHQKVLATLNANKLILVHVTPGSGGAIADVEIVVATRGKAPVKVGIPLMADEPEALLAELERKAVRAFTGAPPPTAPGDQPPVPEENRDTSGRLNPGEGGSFGEATGATDDPAATTPGDDSPPETATTPPDSGSDPGKDDGGESSGAYDFTRISGTTWAIGGAGAGVFILGVIFHRASAGREDDARSARANTTADIERIRDIESTGKVYNTLGNTGVFLGLVGLGVAGYLGYREAKTPEKEKKLTVGPALFGDGIGVTARWSR